LITGIVPKIEVFLREFKNCRIESLKEQAFYKSPLFPGDFYLAEAIKDHYMAAFC
jgi:hypothetical protein